MQKPLSIENKIIMSCYMSHIRSSKSHSANNRVIMTLSQAQARYTYSTPLVCSSVCLCTCICCTGTMRLLKSTVLQDKKLRSRIIYTQVGRQTNQRSTIHHACACTLRITDKPVRNTSRQSKASYGQ